MKRFRRDLVLASVIFVAALLLDLVTKQFFMAFEGADYGWISFHLVKNTGASFGMLKSFNLLFIFLSFIALGAVAYYYSKVERLPRILLALIAAGIAGNLINRITYGYVIDFIDLKWFPVFNVADSLISVCVIILFVLLLRQK